MSDIQKLAALLKRKRTARGIANAEASARASVGKIDAKTAALTRKMFNEDPIW